MEKTNANGNLQEVLSNTLRQLATTSLKAYRPMMDVMLSGVSAMSKSVEKGDLGNLKIPMLSGEDCDCCPPKNECPPHCIAAIHRCAVIGERILVPFMVKNTCKKAKTWRVGIRELQDEDGKAALSQPVLNKTEITVEPGRSERVVLMMDLSKLGQNGTGKYATEIVLREANINQNICFTLDVTEGCEIVTAEPKDEQKMMMRWQSWQSHFYCEPKKGGATAVNPNYTPNNPGPATQAPTQTNVPK